MQLFKKGTTTFSEISVLFTTFQDIRLSSRSSHPGKMLASAIHPLQAVSRKAVKKGASSLVVRFQQTDALKFVQLFLANIAPFGSIEGAATPFSAFILPEISVQIRVVGQNPPQISMEKTLNF